MRPRSRTELIISTSPFRALNRAMGSFTETEIDFSYMEFIRCYSTKCLLCCVQGKKSIDQGEGGTWKAAKGLSAEGAGLVAGNQPSGWGESSAEKPGMDIQGPIHTRDFQCDFVSDFTYETRPYPARTDAFSREASRGLEKWFSHISWGHSSVQFMLTWRDFVALLYGENGAHVSGFIQNRNYRDNEWRNVLVWSWTVWDVSTIVAKIVETIGPIWIVVSKNDRLNLYQAFCPW